MRLKRLSVRGFKSFADKTEFEFDSDLTGIVGPNGCGKSNVVDALKWVLGDQRAKSLRGAEMTDVIFKGAEGRDALPWAEVTVILEDDNGALGGHSEVAIGRRLNRDKESQYKINGDVVRLKDVRDLLMDTGLGVGAYSVMEQGRIDAVLSANPESRRAIFEEAAGISRFKLQKRESLRKLERTEQNLARAKDLLEERARRIRSLKIQAGRAKRYLELHAQLTDLRTALAVVDARELGARHVEFELETRQCDNDLQQVAQQHAELSASLAELERGIVGCEGELESAQETQRQMQSRRDSTRNRRETQSERSQELRKDSEASVARAGNLSTQQGERRDMLAAARERLVGLEEELIGLHKELETRRADSKRARKVVLDLQNERETLRDVVLEKIHARTRCRNLAHDQEAQLRSLDARRQRVQQQDAALDAQRLEREAERMELETSLKTQAQRIAELAQQESDTLSALEAIDRQSGDLARRESKFRERLAAVSSRHEMLRGLESQLEGLDQGPKYLLKQQPAGLRGRLLDLLTIDLEHGRALEAVLGPFLQALVVDTRANAESMLRELHTAEAGRVLLLVEEEFARQRSAQSPLGMPADAEFLFARVTCPEGSKPLLHWLLRGVCLVDDLSQASTDRPDLCFVTRSGDLLCGPRLEGGEGGSEAGLLLRKTLIRDLDVEAKTLKNELEGLQAEMRSTADRSHATKNAARSLAEELQGGRQQEHRDAAELEQLGVLVEHLAQQRSESELELAEVSQQRYQALATLGAHLLDECLLRRLEVKAGQSEQDMAGRLDVARSESESILGHEQELRIRQASCSTDRDAQAQKIESHQQMLQDLERAARDLTERGDEAAQGAEIAAREAELCVQQLQQCELDLVGLTAARDRAAAKLSSCRAEKSDQQGALQDCDAKRNRLQQVLSELNLRRADNEHRFARLEERLVEETGVELRRCLGDVRGLGLVDAEYQGPQALGATICLQGPLQPQAMLAAELGLNCLWEREDFEADTARKEVEVLKSRADRLGSVNLEAVGELDQEVENLVGTENDVTDLTEARRSLMEALRRMETESRALFQETFETARKHFKEIFRKLFQGGRADMYLHDDEDALESGIEIVAKPPGKELQSIALLSGGERSLTALAILFAVFKVKPSPFCILDEVDAALDDTNVERFLRVMKDFVGPSQFCVVTHHKRTMAECKTLYGVTMQRRGVSTRIAVTLDEVDAFANGSKHSVKATDRRIAGEESIGFE